MNTAVFQEIKILAKEMQEVNKLKQSGNWQQLL